MMTQSTADLISYIEQTLPLMGIHAAVDPEAVAEQFARMIQFAEQVNAFALPETLEPIAGFEP